MSEDTTRKLDITSFRIKFDPLLSLVNHQLKTAWCHISLYTEGMETRRISTRECEAAVSSNQEGLAWVFLELVQLVLVRSQGWIKIMTKKRCENNHKK